MTADAEAKAGEIVKISELPTYGPPGHTGTTNVRLVEHHFNGQFELVHGTLEPGGMAERHQHADASQVIYVQTGRARVTLGDDPPQICEPETIIRIPPGVDHEVVSLGPAPLKLVIVYSPPLTR